MGEPTIEITGPRAEKAAHELQGVLRATFGEEGRRLASPTVDSTERKIEPTTLVLIAFGPSIPGANDTTLDLAAQMKLVKQCKRLIAWAQARAHGGTRIALISTRGKAIDLAQADPAEVIEAISDAPLDTETP